MNLKFETIIYILSRFTVSKNAVIILKNTNEYYRKFFSKNGHKMDLYPAMATSVKSLNSE